MTHSRRAQVHAAGGAGDAACLKKRVEREQKVGIRGFHLVHVPCSKLSIDSFRVGARTLTMSTDTRLARQLAPFPPDGDSPRSRLVILVTCCLALVLTAMDATIVNIALPAIRSDLHASVAELQWSIDAYTIVVASFLLLAGSIADRFGRRKTFQVGALGLQSRLVAV